MCAHKTLVFFLLKHFLMYYDVEGMATAVFYHIIYWRLGKQRHMLQEYQPVKKLFMVSSWQRKSGFSERITTDDHTFYFQQVVECESFLIPKTHRLFCCGWLPFQVAPSICLYTDCWYPINNKFPKVRSRVFLNNSILNRRFTGLVSCKSGFTRLVIPEWLCVRYLWFSN